MHILVIPSWYKTDKNPYKGIFFEEQARMFQKRGHQVGVLCPEHNPIFMGNTRFKKGLTNDYDDKGIPTFYSSSQSYAPKISRPTLIDLYTLKYKSFQKYKIYQKKYGTPDIIHAHSVIWGGVVASYISKKTDIPFFVTEHYTGWILNGKLYKTIIYRKLLSDVINKSKKTFAVSSFLKNNLVQKYNLSDQSIDVLPNLVNDQFSYRELETVYPPFKLVIIANLVNVKNHLVLFKAIDLLKGKYDINLSVIGQGKLKADLKSYIEKNDLINEVKFLGSLNKQQIIEELSKSHALISPSLLETFGVTIIESLAIGRPVIAYDSGGPRDIIRDDDGIIVKENRPESFADAIENLIKNYEKYDLNEISKSCKKRFCEDTIYKRLISFYKTY